MSVIKVRWSKFFLLAPLGWGILSFVIFSVLKPLLPINQMALAPLWMWLWILQMASVIPFWIWLLKQSLEEEQRTAINIFGVLIPMGKPIYYLVLAYMAAIVAIPLYNT